ncbi:tyrosine-type recombinase/integrase [candidate division KSB1 bacterium]
MTGSIQKKGASYYIVLWIYDPETGRKKQKWIAAGKKKREAERKLTEMAVEVQNGTYKELKKITFREFANLWVETYVKTKTKASTLKSYQSVINNHLFPIFGDRLMTDITTASLQGHVAKRLEKARPKTVINEIVILKEMFKHAARWGYLKVNPAIYIERPRVVEEEMDNLSPEEVRIFLEEASPEHHTLFLTAVLTGMRRGEILGLQWGDINWNNSQIHVKRSIWNNEFVTPKSKYSIRRIDMSPELVSALREHQLRCPKGDLDLIFCNSEGKPLDPANLVHRHFLPALRRSKIRKMRFHDLRHTNVALRIDQGQNIKYIQNQLGHASIQTTLDRYGHLIKEVNTEQALKLDEALGFAQKSG